MGNGSPFINEAEEHCDGICEWVNRHFDIVGFDLLDWSIIKSTKAASSIEDR